MRTTLGACQIYPPRRVIDHSPGLQPWVGSLVSRALKVAPEVSATGGIERLRREPISRPPLSGRFQCLLNPGLKPWAMVLSRFAAKSDRLLENLPTTERQLTDA